MDMSWRRLSKRGDSGVFKYWFWHGVKVVGGRCLGLRA